MPYIVVKIPFRHRARAFYYPGDVRPKPKKIAKAHAMAEVRVFDIDEAKKYSTNPANLPEYGDIVCALKNVLKEIE